MTNTTKIKVTEILPGHIVKTVPSGWSVVLKIDTGEYEGEPVTQLLLVGGLTAFARPGQMCEVSEEAREIVAQAAAADIDLSWYDFEIDADGYAILDGMDPKDWLHAMTMD